MKKVKHILLLVGLGFSLVIAGCGGNQALRSSEKCIESYEDTAKIYEYLGNLFLLNV